MKTQAEIETFVREAEKGIKTEVDLADFTQILTKITVEAALSAELRGHLGHDKHGESASDNYRNGRSFKRLLTEDGCIEIDTPRDCHGSFEPQLVKKRQNHERKSEQFGIISN